MKDFENYECEGQIDLFDIYPKSCCGVVPWLHKTKCCKWSDDKPQKWLMYFICPKCYKRAVDNDGWPVRSHGTFEEAKANAIAVWNDSSTVFSIDEYTKEHGIRLSFGLGEREEWAKLYNMETGELGWSVKLD